ncbi:HAD family hydrolase [Shouchella tritolerans]|uniref:HAD family hydrolase n=1 Tax=Shouchella tritolerans TaxID=2979466 RepID=UPI0021E872D0|nr:HAD-IIB family hydrolase [Shouchella tritolerans]
MYKQLLVSDLDGTLLDEKQQISSENKAAIQAFQACGGQFTIATGRMLSAALPYMEELNIQIPVILGNGTQIYCPKERRLLRSYILKNRESEIERLWRLQSVRVAVLAYIDDCILIPRRNTLISNYESKENVQCEVSMAPPPKLNKLLVIGSAITEAIQAVGALLTECVQSDTTYLELLPPGVSKGQALRDLKQLAALADYRVTAIGDQLNDCSLLTNADFGIAVENAHPVLKKIAVSMTKHHCDHALAAVINESLLVQTQ